LNAVRDSLVRGGDAIRVRGLVQGVGFRPMVWRLAQQCSLVGDVCNDAEGVLIRIWGDEGLRGHFVERLRREAPPLSRIDAIESSVLRGPAPGEAFVIRPSGGGEARTAIAADAATCAACRSDISDPGNRRFRYPFTNCTHCGPRLSILKRIPYDRVHTSMSAFCMCAACAAEYATPADRRFHAQPNACAECGPQLWLEAAADAEVNVAGDPIDATVTLLRAGRILAIKGLGGIHLACDATNTHAVAELRRRKRRAAKPLAVMARDIAMIRRYCRVNEVESELLGSTAAPIVLLECHGGESLAAGVAPGQRRVGFMLPYTPLHHLLMAGLDRPLVLTSGNRSDEPQCIGNEEARERLGRIADALLLHDREIVNRVDDSVVAVIAGAPAVLRRARGYAPAPLRLPETFKAVPPVLALGGELKNTFCLLRDGEAILSQHLGDLEHASAKAASEEALDLYLKMFAHAPQVLAIDSHPEYLSSKFGRTWASERGMTLHPVQHHHAHIAACLADSGQPLDAPPVLGIALDGAGYGDDGTLWGGEFLLANYHASSRLGALAAVRMPGGAQAIHQPWRMAYAHLRRACDGSDPRAGYAHLPFFSALEDKPLAILDRMIDSGLNSPLTSSVGRLFDAVAATTGLCQVASYEGQPAIALEALVATPALEDGQGYPFAIESREGLPRLEPRPLWHALLFDLARGIPTPVIAARFHAGLIRALVQMVEHLTLRHGDAWGGRVALSGGVFQNAILSTLLIEQLESRGLTVFRHARVPANDGGLSLGQAAVAAAHAPYRCGRS